MKKIIILLTILISQIGFSQTAYQTGMTQASQFATEGKFMEAANLYERIAKAEPENWLPAYYVSLYNVLITLTSEDKTSAEERLKIAGEYADIADLLSPDNSEVHVIKALVNVGWIVYDPMTYGMSLSNKTNEHYAKAIELNKNNPRAHSGLIEMEMGSAKYFNQDLTPFCERLKKTIPLYEAFKPADEFYPNWGKENIINTIKSCE